MILNQYKQVYANGHPPKVGDIIAPISADEYHKKIVYRFNMGGTSPETTYKVDKIYDGFIYIKSPLGESQFFWAKRFRPVNLVPLPIEDLV